MLSNLDGAFASAVVVSLVHWYFKHFSPPTIQAHTHIALRKLIGERHDPTKEKRQNAKHCCSYDPVPWRLGTVWYRRAGEPCRNLRSKLCIFFKLWCGFMGGNQTCWDVSLTAENIHSCHSCHATPPHDDMKMKNKQNNIIFTTLVSRPAICLKRNKINNLQFWRPVCEHFFTPPRQNFPCGWGVWRSGQPTNGYNICRTKALSLWSRSMLLVSPEQGNSFFNSKLVVNFFFTNSLKNLASGPIEVWGGLGQPAWDLEGSTINLRRAPDRKLQPHKGSKVSDKGSKSRFLFLCSGLLIGGLNLWSGLFICKCWSSLQLLGSSHGSLFCWFRSPAKISARGSLCFEISLGCPGG